MFHGLSQLLGAMNGRSVSRRFLSLRGQISFHKTLTNSLRSDSLCLVCAVLKLFFFFASRAPLIAVPWPLF